MGHLMQADPSLTLQDAYDRAVWADPKLRGERIKAEQERAEAERRKAEAERARAARAASVSVRDNPPGTNGAPVDIRGLPLRDQLRAAIRNQVNG